jgi:uncharacterized membrane protein
MENWILMGLLAAVGFGLCSILQKMALANGSGADEWKAVAVMVGVGILATFIIYSALQGNGLQMPSNNKVLMLGVAAGIFWGLATLAVLAAFAGGADASRITPIFNMNTLVVVALAIVLLGELPTQAEMVRVVAGAVLIVIGGILVST